MKVTVTLPELRAAIEAEEKRLRRRPVPTAPWAMPLTLDDLRAFIEVVERAQDLRDTGAWNSAAAIPTREMIAAERALEFALGSFS